MNIFKKRLAILLIGPILIVSGGVPTLGSHQGDGIFLTPITSSPLSVDPGSTAIHQVTIFNEGSAGTFDLTATVGDPSNFSAVITEAFGPTLTSVALPAHGTVEIWLQVTADADAPYLASETTTLTTVKQGDPSITASLDRVTQVNEGPAVALVKSVDDATPGVGQQVTFTIEYQNPNPQTVTAFTITDTVDSRLTINSVGAPGAAAGNTIVWNLGDIAGATTGTVTFTATVGIVPNGASIPNQASGNGSNVAAGASNLVSLAVAAPTLSISKAVSSPTARPGDPLTYTISYRNTGDQDLTNFTITDVVSGDLTVGSISPPGSQAGNTITWSFATLPQGGATQTVTFDATVNLVADGTTITNTATGDGDQVDPVVTNQVITTINSEADLVIGKTDAPDPVNAGEDLVYTLTVRNDGPNDNSGYVVTDNLPAEVSFVTATLGCSHSAGTVTCASAGIPSGASATYTVTATVLSSVPDGSVITNTATVSTTGTTDPNPANNAATAATTVQARADLSVVKTDSPDPVTAGTNLSYTIAMTNNGPSDNAGFTLTDFLPSGVSFVTATAGCAEAAGTVTCMNTGLPTGSAVTYTITVQVGSSVPNGTLLSNTAVISGTSTFDPEPFNDFSIIDTTVQTSADLVVTKTDSPDPVIAGNNLTYTIAVANSGPSDNAGFTLTDVLPAGLSFVTATAGCAEAAGTVTCTNAGLPTGSAVTYTITAQVLSSVPDGSVITNTAGITANLTPDPDPSNDSSTVTTTVVTEADLVVTKTDTPDPVNPTENLTYTIVVTNNGPSDALSFSVTDDIPAGTTFVTATVSDCAESGGTVTCSSPGLVSGASATWTVVVNVNAGVTDGTVITNLAEIAAASTTDSDATNDTATATTTVTAPVLSLTKTAVPPSGSDISPGEDVAYTITYSNTGSGAATNFVITDTVSPLLGGVTVSGGGTYDVASGVITWVVGTVAPGTTGTVGFTATAGATLSTVNVTNRALAIATELAGPIQSNQTTHRLRPPNVVIVKSADRAELSELKAFETVTYRLTITSRAGGNALNVLVTDTPPPYLNYVAGTTVVAGVPVADSGGTSSLFGPGINLGTLTPGTTRVVEFQMKVDVAAPAGQLLENWGYVTWNLGTQTSGDFYRLLVFTPRAGPLLRQTILVQGPTGTTIFVTVFNEILGQAIGLLPATGVEMMLFLILALSAVGFGQALSSKIGSNFTRWHE